MIDLEQMRKDMHAGTQGDWIVDETGNTHYIARVPQLEREYIALREAADALAEVSIEIERKCRSEYEAVTIIDQNHLTEALAAYREATK